MRARTIRTVLLAGALCAVSAAALAQGAGPFGVGRPETGFNPRDFGLLAGPVGWIAQQQAEMYRGFAAAVRALRTDWTAAGGLIALAFGYGVLHAAGPGHGKAVISSYMLASHDTLKRGVVIAMASAAVQGLVAVVLVGVLAVVLNATAQTIGRWSGHLEAASYALVLLIGLVMLARKLLSLRPRRPMASLSAAAVSASNDPCCAGHAIAPERLQGPFDVKAAAAAVLAVGLRPCTGAVLILIFALGQQVFGVGVLAVAAMSIGTGLTVAVLASLAVGAKGLAVRLAARRSAAAVVIGHGIDIAGALLLVAFGGLFLMAAMVR